jgi:hypothetical protein
MHAVCAKGKRYVNPVINNKTRAVLTRHRERRFCISKEVSRGLMLFAQLN